jgi:hypothetical protein
MIGMTISHVIFVDDYQSIQFIVTAYYQRREETLPESGSWLFSVFAGAWARAFEKRNC